MRRVSEHRLHCNKKFTSFLPDKHFSQGLQLQITIGEIDLANPEIEITGRVMFYHLLPGEQKICKDHSLSKHDFVNGPFIFEVNTGDLVYKVSTALYFKIPEGVNPNIRQVLTDIQVLPKLDTVDLTGEPLDFVQNLRALNPEKFLQLISRDLEALEASIDVGSQTFFKKWAIASQIINLAGCGMIPTSHISLAAERYSYPYAKTKERLGLNEEIIL